jgi:hypothetical protein
LNEFAPPGQLKRYLPFLMNIGRVITAYVVSPLAAAVYMLFFFWLINDRDPQIWRDLLGIVSMIGFYALIGYVAEGLFGTPLLCWFRRRGYSSLRSFLLGGFAIGFVIWLYWFITLFQLFGQKSLTFNLVFAVAGCIAPALLGTFIFWSIGGRQITNRWTRAEPADLSSTTCV